MRACNRQMRAGGCTSSSSCISASRNCFIGRTLTIHLIKNWRSHNWSPLQRRHMQWCRCRRVRGCWCWSPKPVENGKHPRQNHQKTNDHRCHNDAPAIFQTFNVAALQLKQAQGAQNGSDVLTPHKNSSRIITTFQRTCWIVEKPQDWLQGFHPASTEPLCTYVCRIGVATDGTQNDGATCNEIL